jgi:hypothetical protein
MPTGTAFDTADGGKTWDVKSLGLSGQFSSFTCQDQEQIYAVHISAPSGELWYSKDSGDTWVEFYVPNIAEVERQKHDEDLRGVVSDTSPPSLSVHAAFANRESLWLTTSFLENIESISREVPTTVLDDFRGTLTSICVVPGSRTVWGVGKAGKIVSLSAQALESKKQTFGKRLLERTKIWN